MYVKYYTLYKQSTWIQFEFCCEGSVKKTEFCYNVYKPLL